MKKLNVAIVGFGLSGRYLQAPFFEANPNFNLKTIVSKNQNPALYYPDVAVVKSIEEVLSNPTIDLVSICTPNDTHFEYAKATILADKHVLVEKPFTATSEEATILFELAKEKNKIVAVFQNRRFDSDFLTVTNLIEEKILGEIYNVQINFNRYKPALNPKQWKETLTAGNGIIYDLGAHIIDQTIALFGKPTSISGATFIERQHSVIDDAFDIKLSYKNLIVTLKSSLMIEEDTPRYILHGTKGTFIKYGIDVQEDQLKAGKLPNDTNFGIEPISQSGIFSSVENNSTGKTVPTRRGNWALLFQNLYEAIVFNKSLLIKPAEVQEQIKIIEIVKRLSL